MPGLVFFSVGRCEVDLQVGICEVDLQVGICAPHVLQLMISAIPELQPKSSAECFGRDRVSGILQIAGSFDSH